MYSEYTKRKIVSSKFMFCLTTLDLTVYNKVHQLSEVVSKFIVVNQVGYEKSGEKVYSSESAGL